MSTLFLVGLINALLISFLLNRALHYWLFQNESPAKKARLVAWSALGIVVVLGSLTMGLNQTLTVYPLAIGAWYLLDVRRLRPGPEGHSAARAPGDPVPGASSAPGETTWSVTYQLESGSAKRIAITCGPGWNDVTVRLDGKELLRVPTREELENGCQTTLDRGELRVQLKHSFQGQPELRISLNGRALPGSPGDPAPRLKMAYRSIYLLAGGSVIAGLLGAVSKSETLRAFGFTWSTVGGGLVLAGLGWLVQEKLSRIALGVAIGLFGLEAISHVLSFASRPGIMQQTGGMLVKVGFVAAMAQGFGAIQQIRTARAARSPTAGTIHGRPRTETRSENRP